MHTIKVSIKYDEQSRRDHYCATFSDPQIAKCMGTDTIPTAFMPPMPLSEVISILRKRNPEYIVT